MQSAFHIFVFGVSKSDRSVLAISWYVNNCARMQSICGIYAVKLNNNLGILLHFLLAGLGS